LSYSGAREPIGKSAGDCIGRHYNVKPRGGYYG